MQTNKPFVTKHHVLPECMICGKPTDKIQYFEERKRLRGRQVLVSKIPVPAHTLCWLPRNIALILFIPAFVLIGVGGLGILEGEEFLYILSLCLPGVALAYVFIRVGISLSNAKDKSKLISSLLNYLITLTDESGNESSWANPSQRDSFYQQEITKNRDKLVQKYGEEGKKLIGRIANYAVGVGCSKKGIDFLYYGLPRPETSVSK